MSNEKAFLQEKQQPEKTSDKMLLGALSQGSPDAANVLYLRYAQQLRALVAANCSPMLAKREDVEDIVQSIFGSFFRAASKEMYDVPAGDHLWKLFVVIALNKVRAKGNYHRRYKRDARRLVDGGWLDVAGDYVASNDETSRNLLTLAIDDVMGHLSLEHQQAIQFRIEGFNVAEIAAKLECSKRTTERLLQEARSRIAEMLEKDE